MIVFKKLRWKNFLSFGNQFTEIQLDGNPTNLIIGTNGVGKSTFLDALTFVLYGKAFRKINKPQLINSINSNNALVEIDFEIGGNQYLVRRGIKPNIFEIYENGEVFQQDAKSGDYQNQLEELILKMNYTAFTQIVVLGKAVYTPFMRLTTPKRTELIEELLGLSVFSEMQVDVKDTLKGLNDSIMSTMDRIVINQEKKIVKFDYIKVLSEDKTARLQELQVELDESVQKLSNADLNIRNVAGAIEECNYKMSEYFDVDKKSASFKKLQFDFTSKMGTLNNSIDFFHKNTECPVCTQNIDESFRKNEINAKQNMITNLKDGEQQLHTKVLENQTKIDQRDDIKTEINKYEMSKRQFDTEMKQIKSNIKSIQAKIKTLNAEQGNVNTINEDIAKLTIESDDLTAKLKGYKDNMTYFNEINLLLKDGGVKTLIIKKYLPIFNRMINDYLNKLGIFVTFNLDESFNETILSRNHDKFSYNSFSEGEKLRIDLAILLAWRDISRLKSAKDTNLIIMDEIFDSSLDQSGVDAFVDILPSMKDVNIFVISHTPDKLIDKFKNVINIKKNGNFSEINETDNLY